MSGFSFSGVQEAKQSVGTKTSTGIHEFLVKSIDTEVVKGKDGGEDWTKGVVVLETTKTIVGKDSVGKSINYDILFPKDAEGAEKLGKRLIHIFSKVSTAAKVDVVKEAIQKLDLTSIDTLIKGLKKIAEGRSLRMKVVATQDGKYPQIPLYYAGYAETIDTNPSELKYDEEKEGIKSQPKGAEDAKVDNTYTFPETDQSKPSPKTEDELPPF
jgi:hypothetical protein